MSDKPKTQTVLVRLPTPTLEQLQQQAEVMKRHAERTGGTYREVRDASGNVIMCEFEEADRAS